MSRITELICWLLRASGLISKIYIPFNSDLLEVPIDNSSISDLCLKPTCVNAEQAVDFTVNASRVMSLFNVSSVCMKPGCVKAAATILSNLDEEVKPCDDFYQFACGGWIKRRTIPEDRPHVSVVTEVIDVLKQQIRNLLEKVWVGAEPDFIRMVKVMYDSCMDLKSIENAGGEPLKKALKDLGGWPVLEGDKWNSSSFDWIETLIQLRRKGFNHNVLMTLRVGEDMRNNTAHVIGLDRPSLGISNRKDFLAGSNSSIAAYFKLMVKAAEKLGSDRNTSESELQEVLDFESMLANFSMRDEERQNISNLYNKYTLKQLKDKLPQIDWLKYLNGLLNDPIFENETVIAMDPGFLQKFANLIVETNERVVANYIMWRVVKESLPLLSAEWRLLIQEYDPVDTGQTKEKPRWDQCLTLIHKNFGAALGLYYVRHHFKEENRKAAMNMVDYIHKEFLETIEDIDWMDNETKKHAQEKTKAITSHIGYPSELLNDSYVADLYKNLEFNSKVYFDNIRKMNIWSTDDTYSRLREPFIKGLWKNYARVAAINAYYTPSENSIEFPAGVLQDPLFSNDRPQYLNFGAIGHVIGHEIVHGFDDLGRQFDKNGNNINWWDQETDKRFRQKAQCIIDQYSNYTVGKGVKMNGVSTLGENMADIGGMKVAYKAYHSWASDYGREPSLPGLNYTQKQLFWISAANVMCSKFRPEYLMAFSTHDMGTPAMFRVIGPMSNLPEFAEDFGCSPDSAMVRENKCEVW